MSAGCSEHTAQPAQGRCQLSGLTGPSLAGESGGSEPGCLYWGRGGDCEMEVKVEGVGGGGRKGGRRRWVGGVVGRERGGGVRGGGGGQGSCRRGGGR